MIFDMDGTLLDTRAVVPDAYIVSVLKLGGPEYSREHVIQAYPLGPPSVILGYLLGRAAGTEEVQQYHRTLEELSTAVAGIPEIEVTLQALTNKVHLGVFTGASLQACSILLRSARLQHYFEVLVGGDEVRHPKPHPDGILAVCQRLRVPPASAAYIGDSPLDLEAARRSGALAVAAAWGHQYESMAPADVTVTSPQELLALI